MVPIHFMVKQRDKGVWSLMKRMKKSDLKDPKKSEYMRKFYRTHKDYFTNYNREYYKKRKNELKNKQEKYNKENSERIKIYMKKYYQKNREKYKGYTGSRGKYIK